VDAHVHLNDAGFSKAGWSREALLREAFAAGVAVVADWAVGPEDWLSREGGDDDGVAVVPHAGSQHGGFSSSQGYAPSCIRAHCLRGWGVHPWRAGDPLPTDWAAHLEDGLRKDDHLMVGEAGLDLREGQPPLNRQLEALEPQWRLAQHYDRPLSLHGVHAAGELLRCFDRWGPVRAQLHAFAGSPELAREFARRGAWFSVGVGLLRKRAEQARLLWQALPPARTMLETDSFGSHRPAYLQDLGALLALHFGIEVAELADRTSAAARELLLQSAR
jgi:TatD DNase family protein